MSTRIRTAIAAVLILAGHAAGAQTGAEAASLSTLSADADLVFQGTVTGIKYSPSVEGIPHTFVTYRVEDVLKGSYASPTLTLRFIGGVKTDAQGNVIQRLTVSHSPRFQSGQQDLLMVKNNMQSQCPLVRCAQGRFRFQQGMVTTEEGDALALDPQGNLRTVVRAPEQAGAGDFGPGMRVPAQSADRDVTPFDRTSFVAHVRQVIGQQGFESTSVVQSADPAKPFKGPDLPAVAPRSVPMQLGQASAAAPQSEHDRQEIEALIRNGGNPVLPAKDVDSLRRLPAPPSR